MSWAGVYVGLWTNWDKGRVLGETLTVPRTYGIFLIAAITLIVKWAGSRLWGIVCFAIHHWRTNQRPEDGVYFQHQALLRSRIPETDFLWRLYEILWAWRLSAPSVLRRTYPLATLAILNLAVFILAGIFSARLVVTDNRGLIRGLCGTLEMTANKDFSEWTQSDFESGDVLFGSAYNGYRTNLLYAESCYRAQIKNDSDSKCTVPEIPYIPSTINRNANCPFASEACAGPAISMDSGLINSNSDLGINTPREDRIQFRKVSTCVPIPMDNYSSGWTPFSQPGVEMFTDGASLPTDQFKYYNLGSSWLFDNPISNFTFVMSNYSLFVPGVAYNLNIRTSYARRHDQSGFLPDPAFNRTDADVSILTLNNRVAYTGRVDDPFFQAPVQKTTYRLANAWTSNTTLTGIGCLEQYQFCNPNIPPSSSQCTPLTALYDFPETPPSTYLSFTPLQLATYKLIRTFFYYQRSNMVVQFLKNDILIANSLIWGSFGFSTPLPPNQWHREVENIHNLTLAGLQLNVLDFAAIQDVEIRPGLRVHSHVVPETDPVALQLCNNQRVRTSQYTSFSMLGVGVILGLSFAVIITDAVLPSVVRWVQTSRKSGSASLEAWDEDDILQIQRSALEGQGVGPWKMSTGSVPVTVGWEMKFRRGRTGGPREMKGWAGRGAGGDYDGFEPLRRAERDLDVDKGDIELMKTPRSSVVRL